MTGQVRKTLAPQDALGGGGQTVMWMGQRGHPSPIESLSTEMLQPCPPCPASDHRRSASGLGGFSREVLCLFKGSFQLSSLGLLKTNHNHTPPTQIQLDPDSSGQGAWLLI